MKIACWYYEAYGRGSHARVLDEPKTSNPYVYGTPQWFAWSDGWENRK